MSGRVRVSRWIVAIATAMTGAWMAFDGTRALVVGDYVTPATGPYAGRLGPWANALEAFGIAPRATSVKIAFVIYGATLLMLAVGFAAKQRSRRRLLLVTAVAGLWYLPFGTVLNGVAIALLLTILRPAALSETPHRIQSVR